MYKVLFVSVVQCCHQWLSLWRFDGSVGNSGAWVVSFRCKLQKILWMDWDSNIPLSLSYLCLHSEAFCHADLFPDKLMAAAWNAEKFLLITKYSFDWNIYVKGSGFRIGLWIEF